MSDRELSDKDISKMAAGYRAYNDELSMGRNILSETTREMLKQIEVLNENVSVAKLAIEQQKEAIKNQERIVEGAVSQLSVRKEIQREAEINLKTQKDKLNAMAIEQAELEAMLEGWNGYSTLSAEAALQADERIESLKLGILVQKDFVKGAERDVELQKQATEAAQERLDQQNDILSGLHAELEATEEILKKARNDRWEYIKKTLDSIVPRSKELIETFGDLAAGPLSAVVTLVRLAFDLFKKLDAAAEDFRRTTGLTINQTKELRKNAESLNRQYQDMGVSIEAAYKAAEQLVDAFGGLEVTSADSMRTVSLMAANLGVAEKDAAGVLVTFQGIGGVSEKAANNMIKMGAAITKGTPVSFAKVMNDIAQASDDVYFLLGNTPAVLVKSAIQARALGVSISALASMSKKLLDFQTSINNEMEASALIGRSINFQRARQLAFDGKLADSAKEVLRVVKEAGDWNKMSVFQREALAKASGMELKDLNKMVALDRIRNSSSAAGARLKQLDAQVKLMDDLNKSTEDSLVAQAEEELQQRQMQGVMTDLSNMMKSIFLQLSTILMPIVKVLMTLIIPALKTIGILVKAFEVGLSPIGDLFAKMDTYGLSITHWLDKGSEKLEEFRNWLKDSSAFMKIFVVGLTTAVALMTTMLLKRRAMAALDKASGAGGLLGRITGKIPGLDKLSGSVKGVGNLGGKAIEGITSGLKKLMEVGKVLAKGVGEMISALLQGVAKGVAALGNPKVLLGAVSMIILAGSLWVMAEALKALAGIDWGTIGKAAAIIAGLAVMAIIFGIPAVAGLIVVGAAVLILLGFAMLEFAAAAWVAGKASQEIAKGLTMAIDPLKELANIGAGGLIKAAIGIYAVSAALATFGAGAAMSGIGSLIGRIAGGDPIAKLKELASIGSDLSVTAQAIKDITSAFAEFQNVDRFAKSIDTLSDSLDKLNDSISKISLLSIAKLSAISMLKDRSSTEVTTATQSAPTQITQSPSGSPSAQDAVVGKLSELIELMRAGGISVNLDGRKVS